MCIDKTTGGRKKVGGERKLGAKGKRPRAISKAVGCKNFHPSKKFISQLSVILSGEDPILNFKHKKLKSS